MKHLKKSLLFRILRIITTLILVTVFLIAFEIYISYNWLSINYYEMKSDKIDEALKIIILADLHDHDFQSSFAAA